MWVPRWLGEAYSKLYRTFNSEVFQFAHAQKTLSFGDSKLRAAFSYLHRRRLVLVISQGRPRTYRLLPPDYFVLLASEEISNAERIRQDQYLKLILDLFESIRTKFDLVSFGIYGSAARGTATSTSDLDVLLVSPDFHGGFGKRLGELVGMRRGRVEDEISWLWRHGVYANIGYYPLTPREVEKLPLLFADLTDDAVILYDQNRLLETALARLRTKLLESGASRVSLNRNQWYWDLRPSHKVQAVAAN